MNQSKDLNKIKEEFLPILPSIMRIGDLLNIGYLFLFFTIIPSTTPYTKVRKTIIMTTTLIECAYFQLEPNQTKVPMLL